MKGGNMQQSMGIMDTLKNVENHFENNNGTTRNIAMAKKAIEKASAGFYGICSDCGHIATTEEIYKKPYHCSICGKSFI